MEQDWKAEEKCLAPPAPHGLCQGVQSEHQCYTVPFRSQSWGMGLSMADTHLKQSRLPSGRLRILIQPLSDDSDMMTEVMTLRSSVYRASGWKLKMEGRLKGE